jgi:arylsulfatase A-like enzyme
MDLTASILARTPVPAEAGLDGMNLFPIWEAKAPEVERTLFWRSGGPTRPQTAVRRGDWKLLVDVGHTFVFNVRADMSERHDLAKERQDVAQALSPLLKAWEQDVNAGAGRERPPASSGD